VPPQQQSRARHAAPKDLSRSRTALLPGVLLAAAGTAFAGLAAFPAAAADLTPRVTAASALQPVALPAPQQANLALNSALEQGLKVANSPAPTPPPLEKASRDRDDDAPEADGPTFVRPGLGRLTSSYGRRWGRLHAGIDLASGVGSPVRAVTNATVLSAGWEGGYGRCVRLVHADGTVTVYAHLSAITVNTGERVVAGERIGREGNTGQSTGPHLHFEVRINGTPVNPVSWLRKRGVSL
jgi:murein DD-endopeptidase MepM/ murein hydrolase activator NlpD